jgi:hypothetical protein
VKNEPGCQDGCIYCSPNDRTPEGKVYCSCLDGYFNSDERSGCADYQCYDEEEDLYD